MMALQRQALLLGLISPDRFVLGDRTEMLRTIAFLDLHRHDQDAFEPAADIFVGALGLTPDTGFAIATILLCIQDLRWNIRMTHCPHLASFAGRTRPMFHTAPTARAVFPELFIIEDVQPGAKGEFLPPYTMEKLKDGGTRRSVVIPSHEWVLA